MEQNKRSNYFQVFLVLLIKTQLEFMTVTLYKTEQMHYPLAFCRKIEERYVVELTEVRKLFWD